MQYLEHSSKKAIQGEDASSEVLKSNNDINHQVLFQKSESDTVDWDGWPDGDFSQNFTWEEVEATKNLRAHWSYKANGGYGGDEHASTWQKGKKTSRKCMGVMLCDNHPVCGIVTRPQTTARGIDSQLRKGCDCGAVLIHQQCEVRSFEAHTSSPPSS